MVKELDVKDFAERVERVCDFLLDKSERDGSEDRKVIEDLKNDAADIQFEKIKLNLDPLVGLSVYMKGV